MSKNMCTCVHLVVVIHIVDLSRCIDVSSRMVREMSKYVYIFHVIIFFTRTEELAETNGSSWERTEADRSAENGQKYLK